MVEVDKVETNPVLRRRIIPEMKKVAHKSAEGTKKAIQATMDLPVAAAKATKGAVNVIAKAVTCTKREVVVANEPDAAVVGAGRNTSEGVALKSWDSDVMVDGPPIDNNNAKVDSTGTGITIVLGRFTDFLTTDATIIMIALFSVALTSSFRNWQSIFDTQIPLSVPGSWLILAFALGQVFSIPKLKRSHRVSLSTKAVSSVSCSSFDSKILPEAVGTPSTLCIEEEEEKADTHWFFLRLFGRKQQQEPIKSKAMPASAAKSRPSWTNLQPNHEKTHRWERTYDPTKDTKRRGDLMRRLLRNKNFRRSARLPPLQEKVIHMGTSPLPLSTSLGAFDPSKTTADSLDDFVIEPILKLRGMDVFLADDLESHVASHPWLISQGLRDVPTLVINIITQWGHILVYFEMPVWVQDWNSIVEDECDPDDIKAFKRYLNGDSEYRNERLKVIPSLVEGPLAMKVLAPPKKEMLLHCTTLPVSWKQYDPETTSMGRKLYPALEVTLDCVSSRSMRTVTGIVTRSARRMSMDMATVIGKPAGQADNEGELEACLGLWRMDHIDVSACPQFPDRFANEASRKGQDPDVLRASKVVHMTDSELQELAAPSS